jgi:hypothetical protein
MVLETYDLHQSEFMPIDSIGVGVVPELDQVWIASGQNGGEDRGVATRFEVAGGEVAHVSVGRSPHTQGDLTGGQLVPEFEPEGVATHVFTGCEDDPMSTRWQRLHISADTGGAGTIDVELRHAVDLDALGDAAWVRLGLIPDDRPPFDLTLPEGGVVEVRLTLRTSARDGAPRVRRVGLEWECPGPI